MFKGKDAQRLLVYLLFAFGFTWCLFLPYLFAGNVWGENGARDQLAALGMLCPTLAMLAARYVTKEGFAVTGEDSMVLGISFKNGKWVWFLAAMLLPWIYYEAGHGLLFALQPAAFDLHSPMIAEMEEITGNDHSLIYLQPLSAIVTGTVVSFAAFGEEAGWRGYMMPKMIKLWGVNRAVVIGGFIWGMWHWPLTYVGHNFGREYWGYPFTGFLAMGIFCIFIGVLLTFVTVRSGSVWPATIMHAVNNASPSVLMFYFNEEKISGWWRDRLVIFGITFLPMMVMAVIAWKKLNQVSGIEKTENS